jgi:hypothetical protein
MFPITSSMAVRQSNSRLIAPNTLCYPGPVSTAIERRDLASDPLPGNLAGKLYQFALQADVVTESGSNQTA